ncbi:choice-of-anchor H family protein [Thalassotalea psychrophila]|uniref:Choice-of-anchor H family protein n=1 Tax=Thalassotalea psychrophila TaxID=3065647 RepID=A0ABY9TUA4_9GAMM|nr:choice-of-anchor H family protein [Colwelliaceae bacterium SQ149]
MNIPEKFNFVDKFLLSTLAILLFLLAIQVLMVLFGFNKAYAQEQTNPPALKTVSFGQKQQSFSEQDKLNFIEQSRTQSFSDQDIGKATSFTRAQRLKTTSTNENALASKSATMATINSSYYSHEFTIYDAQSYLFDDFDEDGYYQTFSVVFDADVISNIANERADVYAELYLSVDGGPWTHYFSTDIFTIAGENIDDEYEVVTTLYEGYYSDNYDVLIDLYEVGYSGLVATFSSDDSDALYALPLESDEHDTYYDDHYHDDHHHHSGSAGIWGIIMMLMVLFQRKIKRSNVAISKTKQVVVKEIAI